jgi:hypothetical protein
MGGMYLSFELFNPLLDMVARHRAQQALAAAVAAERGVDEAHASWSGRVTDDALFASRSALALAAVRESVHARVSLSRLRAVEFPASALSPSANVVLATQLASAGSAHSAAGAPLRRPASTNSIDPGCCSTDPGPARAAHGGAVPRCDGDIGESLTSPDLRDAATARRNAKGRLQF